MLGRTVCKSMVTFLSEITRRFASADASLHDPVKSVVVVFGIKTGFGFRRTVSAADNASCAPIRRTGAGDGVFAVIPSWPALQMPLAIAEYRAVLRIHAPTA